MIIDGFIFFNELDILEARLNYLYNHVDYFILVESNVSHKGKSKPLYFLENQQRFQKFKSKIIYYPFIFDNSQHNIDFTVEVQENEYSTPYWFLENSQRNKISECALKFFNPDDLLLISDADEIPNLGAIDFAKNNLTTTITCAAFAQTMFYYNLANKKPAPWIGTVITKIENLNNKDAQWFRNHRYDKDQLPEIYNAGWHCSYFGNIDQIINKLENFAHQEFNNDYYKSKDRIEETIKNSKDLFNRSHEDLIFNFDVNEFPNDFLTAFKKFIPDINHILGHITSAWKGHEQFAYWLVNEIKPKITVDLGVDYGFSTFALSHNNPGIVYGIDCFSGDEHAGFRDTLEYVNNIKNTYAFNNVEFIKGDFNEVASQWRETIDLIHIDGLHTYDAVKNDYETWKKFTNQNTVFLFHDTESYKNDVGKFFNELDLHKVNFTNSSGLGVASQNEHIINLIAQNYNIPRLNRTDNKIVIFLHLVDLEGYKGITQEIFDSLENSNILQHADLYVYCNYNIDNFNWLIEKYKDNKNIKFIQVKDAIDKELEIPTLIELKKFCNSLTEEKYILYLHIKGISWIHHTPTNLYTKDWREFLLHFNVNKWKECVEKLDNGFDTVGVNWKIDHQYHHYSGNFWWANSEYIKKLPNFVRPKDINYVSQFNFSDITDKYDAEFWIGIGSPRACSLHQSNVNHYHQPYPKYIYS